MTTTAGSFMTDANVWRIKDPPVAIGILCYTPVSKQQLLIDRITATIIFRNYEYT